MPQGHWRTLTFLGALRRLTAPCIFDGPINAYVEQQLVPVLQPGDIVIMDNLGSHKSAAAPHDQHWTRIAQKHTIEDTGRHIGELVVSIELHECGNYFANAGYASVKV